MKTNFDSTEFGRVISQLPDYRRLIWAVRIVVGFVLIQFAFFGLWLARSDVVDKSDRGVTVLGKWPYISIPLLIATGLMIWLALRLNEKTIEVYYRRADLKAPNGPLIASRAAVDSAVKKAVFVRSRTGL